MIEYVIAIIISGMPLFLDDVVVASLVVALAMLSAPTTCPIICNDVVGLLMASSLWGVLVNVISLIMNLDDLASYLILVGGSVVMAVVYAYGFENDIVEEISEWSVVALIMLLIGLLNAFPEVGSQAMYIIAGGLWVVESSLAQIYLAIAMFVLSISVVLREHIIGSMFDKDYVKAVGSSTFLRYFLLSVLSVVGISSTAYTLGLFSTQTVLILPTLISLKILGRSIEEVVPLSFSIAVSSLTVGAFFSIEYGVSTIGMSSAIMVILMILLKLWECKGCGTRIIKGSCGIDKFIGYGSQQGEKQKVNIREGEGSNKTA